MLVVRTLLLLLLSTAFLPYGLKRADAQGPGFPNVEQVKGTLVSGPWAPNGGRTAVIAFHQGYLITQYEAPGSKAGSDGLARFFDMSDLRNLRETTFDAGWNAAAAAHGYWQEGTVIRGFRNWTFSGSSIVRLEDGDAGDTFYNPWSAGVGPQYEWPGRGILYQPWHMSMYWSYGNTSHKAGLFKGNQLLSDWNPAAETGVIGHPMLLGTWLIYASDQSDTGIAIYDITPSLDSPGTKPRLIGLYREPVNPAEPNKSVGGYWPELWGGGGRLKILFPDRGDGIHIVDITDPNNMVRELSWKWESHGDWWRAPDPNYAQFQDNFGFTDKYKINMSTLQIEEMFNPIPLGINVSQFTLPLGNLVVTGGYNIEPVGPNAQGMAIWAHQAAPDTTGPSVGYHMPRNGTRNYHRSAPVTLMIHETLRTETIVNGTTFSVRPVSPENVLGEPVAGRLVFSFNDALTFTPYGQFATDTTYHVEVSAGGIKDAANNGMQRYSFRFSTGDSYVADPTSQLPDSGGDTPGSNLIPIPFTVKTKRKTGTPHQVHFRMPSELLKQLPKKRRSKRQSGSAATLEVLLNGSAVKNTKLARRRVVRTRLPARRVKELHTPDGPNSLEVGVYLNGTKVGEGTSSY